MQKNLVSESDPLAGRAAVVRTRPATFEKVAAQRSCHEEMDALYAACPGGIAAPLHAGMRLLTAVSCEDARSPTLQQDSCKDRKSTRLNSSHVAISYAVFCL